jgi:hypothetical protein
MADDSPQERVELVRTGGFANIPVRAGVPAEALTESERAALEDLLSRPAAKGAVEGAPDRYQYDITVVTGGRQHDVRLAEADIDERLRPLIKRLERDATF